MATVAPSNFFCPISQEMMHDPVITMDGHSYEREQIESWFRRSTLSPVTGGALTHVHLLHGLFSKLKRSKSGVFLRFQEENTFGQ